MSATITVWELAFWIWVAGAVFLCWSIPRYTDRGPWYTWAFLALTWPVSVPFFYWLGKK